MPTMTPELAGKLQGDILRLQQLYKKEFHISQVDANLRAATEIANREGYPDVQSLRSALGEYRFGATGTPVRRRKRTQKKLPLAIVSDQTTHIVDELLKGLGSQDGRLPLDWQTAMSMGNGVTPYMVGQARRELTNRGWLIRYKNDGYDCIAPQVKAPVEVATVIDVAKPTPITEPMPIVADAEQIGPMIHELLSLSKAQLQMQAGTYRKLGELVELVAKVWQ